MPLPHFLLLMIVVLLAAVLTLWVAFAAGVPELVLVLFALTAAALLHLDHRNRHDHRG